MLIAEDFINKKFDNWTVLSLVRKDKRAHYYFKCQCSCKKIKIVRLDQLRLGKSKKCNSCANSLKTSTHRMSHCSTYHIWVGMKNRCINKNAHNYERYGGRNIKVCERWRTGFENFVTDMGIRPLGLQIDRIDVYGDYCPENCRWVTPKQNSGNRRCTKKENGEKKDAVICNKEQNTCLTN